MSFSIIIATYNNLEGLKECLEGLKDQGGIEFEALICVDGFCTDGTFKFLEKAEYPFPVKTLHHAEKENRGRSATRNLALGNINHPYVLLLDGDMIPEPGLLQAHLNMIEKGGTVSIGSIRYDMSKKNKWVRYIAGRGVAKFNQGEAVPPNYFIAANSAFPSRYFSETGGFDEKINRYGGEDMELGHRIWLKFKPVFRYNLQAGCSAKQEKTLKEALLQIKEYGSTGRRYIHEKFPELDPIYWIDKIHSRKIKDRMISFMLKPIWRPLVRVGLVILPWSMQQTLITWLVVSYMHEGYRNG